MHIIARKTKTKGGLSMLCPTCLVANMAVQGPILPMPRMSDTYKPNEGKTGESKFHKACLKRR
jgi:hypothetical protein